jgi:hypothetical protein
MSKILIELSQDREGTIKKYGDNPRFKDVIADFSVLLREYLAEKEPKPTTSQ